jgi:chromosome segregation ATPase
MQGRLKDIQLQHSEAQSKELSMQFELSKVSRERELLIKQVSSLETEINRLSSSERSKFMESNEKIHTLEMKLAMMEGDLNAKNKEVSMLKVKFNLYFYVLISNRIKMHSL